jgi:flagellar motor switch protein FliM
MSDILSQEEVDALLSAVSTGDVATQPAAAASGVSAGTAVRASQGEKSIALYDFRRPDRISKDQMRTLQNLHEGYARLFSTSLTSYLRTLVEIELVSVDQLTYSEFIMSISNPSCIYIFQMEPLEGQAIFEVNPSLVFFILDRLFGGQGKPTEQNRELTDIEQHVMVRIIDRGLSDLKEVWERIGIFSPKIENYETNPQFVQIAPPGETVILISLEVRMQNASGLMSLCFPYILLENVLEKLSGETWMSSQRTSTHETRKVIRNEIMGLPVLVQAIIGETELTVRDLLQLQEGDVICLDKPEKEDLILRVGDKTKMACRPGLVGRKKAVQVTQIIEKEVPGAS